VVDLDEHYFTENPTSALRLGLLKCRLRGYDFELLTASGVFSHKRIDAGTRLLIESMMLTNRGDALDLGCGYGPIGIVAAKMMPKLQVWMTDINQRAVDLAKENAIRNGVENVQFLRGSLYEPVKGRSFDIILTNPPITAGIRKVVEPIIKGSTNHLKKGGSLQMVFRTKKGGEHLTALLERYYRGFEVIARKGGYRVVKAQEIL